MRVLMLSFICVPVTAQMQHFSFQVTGGVPLGAVTARTPSRLLFGADESRPYTFGVGMGLLLNEHVSLEVNPLYKRTGSRFIFFSSPNAIFPPGSEQLMESTSRMRSHSLELPVIGRYTFRPGAKSWRPFAGAGFAFQSSWQTFRTRNVLRDSSTGITRTAEFQSDSRTPTDAGAVFSGGVSFRWGRIQLVPELRFTRWGAANTSHRRSQAQALFSIRF